MTDPIYETFDVTANTSALNELENTNVDAPTPKIVAKKRPRRKRNDTSLPVNVTVEENAETTNQAYETFVVSENVPASKPEDTFNASTSDISYESSAAEKVKQRSRKVGLSHYINPRPESIASRQGIQVFLSACKKLTLFRRKVTTSS